MKGNMTDETHDGRGGFRLADGTFVPAALDENFRLNPVRDPQLINQATGMATDEWFEKMALAVELEPGDSGYPDPLLLNVGHLALSLGRLYPAWSPSRIRIFIENTGGEYDIVEAEDDEEPAEDPPAAAPGTAAPSAASPTPAASSNATPESPSTPPETPPLSGHPA